MEHLVPTDLLTYMLAGNAAQVDSSIRVGEASSWKVVKAVLTAKYAMSWHRFLDCRLEAGDTVDIYLGHLERLGGRLGLTLNDLAFRV